MGFDACIKDNWAITSPVLVCIEFINAVYIMRWIRSGEGHPKKVFAILSGKIGIVTPNQEGYSKGWSSFFFHRFIDSLHFFQGCLLINIRLGLKGSYTRHDHPAISPITDSLQCFRQFNGQCSDRISIGGKNYLAACIQTSSGIIQGVHGSIGMKMNIAISVQAF